MGQAETMSPERMAALKDNVYKSLPDEGIPEWRDLGEVLGEDRDAYRMFSGLSETGEGGGIETVQTFFKPLGYDVKQEGAKLQIQELA